MNRNASLNHTFRTIWSDVKQAYVAVSEHTKGKGKSKSSKAGIAAAALAALLGIGSSSAVAGPEGGVITSGNGSITQNGNVTDIHQQSQTLNANWDSFNVNQNETVNFHQPSKTSLAVNNILDTNGSRIMGNLNANGQVWLINPNGVFFGQNATVNVGSILAATLNPLGDITTDGRQVFGNGGTGSIVNEGTINAESGYVAFIGNKVSNQGNITANNGTVALGAGSQVTVQFAGSNLLSLTVDQSTLDNLAENKQLIQANGGMVLMSAGARDSLLASVVNNTGKIEAKTVQHKDGKIILMGGMKAGTTKVAGTLDASAETGDGGFIETSAANVQIAADTKVTTQAANGETGTWLIDPTDFNITAGNGVQTTSSIGADTLATNLGTNNVQIQTQAAGAEDGDINVNAEVTWASNNDLTLSAHNDININKSITATGSSAKLILEYGQANVAEGNTAQYNINNKASLQAGNNFTTKVNLQAGNNFSTKLGSDGVTKEFKVITELGTPASIAPDTLRGISYAVAGHYVLGADIDASSTSSWWGAGDNFGFQPLSNSLSNFTGTFDGLGHTINDLTMHQPDWYQDIGLFGFTYGASIRNVGLVDVNVTGHNLVGGLVGYSWDTSISNVYVTGTVTGDGRRGEGKWVGGLVGSSYNSTINNAYAAVSVAGAQDFVGGLVGLNSANSTISNAYATGDVSGRNYVGGLTGYNSQQSIVSNAYATGDVSGGDSVGGLVGQNSHSTISNAYATGDVSGRNYIGGLTGYSLQSPTSNAYATGDVSGNYYVGGLTGLNHTNSDISNAYATGDVSGVRFVGGLAGYSQQSIVSNAYATGDVSGNEYIGGLVGLNHTNSTISNSFWNTETSNQPTVGVGTGSSAGVSGKTTIEMQTLSTLTAAGWDISANGGENTVWRIYEGHTAPLLRSFMTSFDLGVTTSTYNGLAQSATSYTDPLILGNAATGTNVNTYQTNYYSTQQGYDLVNGDLIIDQLIIDLTAEATAQNKTYDGNRTANVNVFSNDIINNDVVTFSHSNALFDTKDAGTNKTVTVSGIATGGADAANYALQNTTATTTANIDQKLITATATANNKTYDGNKTAIVNSLTSAGLIAGDTVSFTNTAANFADANVGTSKTVTVTGINAAGADAGNYSFASTAATTADITPLGITATATALDKIYNGNTVALIDSVSSTGVLAGDSVLFSGTGATFDNKNVGTNKTVNVTGLMTSGADASNYQLLNTTATATADITPLSVMVNAVAQDKVYDGNKTAIVKSLTSAGIIAGDTVSFSSTLAEFDTKNVGTSKVVTVSGLSAAGADANNYSFAPSTITTADITAKNIAVVATADNKVYDGNTTAIVSALTSAGLIAGDSVSFSNTAANFADANAGVGKTVTVTGIGATGTDAGNYQLQNTTATTTADINKADAVVTANSDTVTYNGVSQQVTGFTATGLVNGETESVLGQVTTSGGVGTNVGNYAHTASGTDENYNLSFQAGSLEINPFALTVTATADNKVYDGNTTAIVSALTSAGLIAGDSVSFNNTAANFDTKNVGTNKTVTVSGISTSGADAGNYALQNTTATTQADITAKNITVAATADNKVYDGNKTAIVNSLTSAGIIAGDTVSFTSTSAEFDTKNVGTNKAVSVTGINATGADAGNYSFSSTAATTADITAKNITVDATADNKVYDGNTTAIVNSLTSAGIIGSDAVSFTSTSAEFDTKNVGTNKAVSVTGINATGADAGNYSFSSTAATTADITAKNITVAATADNKVYDGNTTAVVSALTSAGLIAGDTVSFTNTAANFADPNVGTGKTVSVTGINATGADAGNYALQNTTATAQADITAKNITVAATADNKVYDGNTTAIVSALTSAGLIAGDSVSFSNTTANFDTKNVGTNKTVTVSGISTSGADAGNYALQNTTATAQADITAKNITVAATANNKVYDGNTTAIVSALTSAGIIAGDNVNFSHAAANFDTKNVGQNKPVTVTGISASGADAGNYSFNPVAVTNADITAKHITLRAYASDKVYDGTTNAWLGTNVNGDPHFEHDGMVAGDNFWFSFSKASGQFSDKNVGNNKTFRFTGVTANGADKGNYTYDIQNVYSTASITPKHIEQTVYAHNKVYDDNNSASLAGYEAKGIVAGDQAWMVYDNANGWFDNKQVGVNKTVTFTGMQLIGADQGNYTYTPTEQTKADITLRKGYTQQFLSNFKGYFDQYVPEISAIILNEPKKLSRSLPQTQDDEE